MRPSKVKYFCSSDQMPFFFTNELTNTVEYLADKLGEKAQVWVYPDANIKPNGLPTGISCASPADETILLPFVLRDPGCGYLVFKLRFIEQPPTDWKNSLGQLLSNFVENKTLSKGAQKSKSLDINAMLTQGIHALTTQSSEIDKFHDAVFPIGAESIQLTSDESALLHDGFLDVTNTIEIRALHSTSSSPNDLSSYGIETDDYIGFIHTGSEAFPKVLAERFVYDIAEYADLNGLFTLDEIKKGIFGVPSATPLGKEYEMWLRAAMNYALANRYAVYLAMKQEIEAHLPCRLTMINDNVHAGLFNKTVGAESINYSVRGVQRLSSGLNLLAGQRESIAALVVAGSESKSYQNLICHGTSYHIRQDYDYKAEFSPQDSSAYHQLAEDTFYNTEPQLDECIPYTYNLLQQLHYFKEAGLCETAVTLEPLINIHGSLLKANEAKSRKMV